MAWFLLSIAIVAEIAGTLLLKASDGLSKLWPSLGFALGVGISMFSSLSHRLFGGENLKVWIIETANDAMNLTIAGAIIAVLN